MKEITIEENKKLLVEILNALDDFCREKGLTYYIDGGTLLGAVRHQGFIPWDDDIDVVMRPKDYEIILKTFNENRSDPFRLICLENDPAHIWLHAKVIRTDTLLREDVWGDNPDIGVNIDIFRVDFLPEDLEACRRFLGKPPLMFRLAEWKMTRLSKKRSWIKNGLILLSRIFCPVSNRKMAERAVARNRAFSAEKEGTWCAVLDGGSGVVEITKSAAYDSTVLLPFEGRMYPAPVGYDERLRNLYGDYMQLPPVEKRITHHAVNAFWREDR